MPTFRTRFASIVGALVVVGALSTAAGAAAAPVAPSATTGPVSSVAPTSAQVTGTVNPEASATTWYFEFGLSSSATYTSKTPVKSAGTGTADVAVAATLTGLSAATSYHYRLVATSPGGTVYGASALVATSAPPTAVTGEATHLGASSATLGGTVNPEGEATTWRFEYGTSTSYGSYTPTSKIPAGPNDVNVSVVVSDLTPRTTYHFRLTASSPAGTTYGSDLTLTTGLSVTLNASTTALTYSQSVTLSGAVTNQRAGDKVTVLSERFDATAFSPIAQVTTSAGGNWSFTLQPTYRTTYEVQADNGTSSPVVVGVRPVVYLTVLGRGTLSTRVIGAIDFSNHVLQLQRLDRGIWITYKHVRLGVGAKVTFSTALPKGRSQIRMAIGPFVPGLNQAAPGYLAGYSKVQSYLQH